MDRKSNLVLHCRTTPKITESGKVLLSHGQAVQDWKNADFTKPSISKSTNVMYDQVPTEVMYMFELLPEKMATMLSACWDFGMDMSKAWHKVSKKNISYSMNSFQISQKAFRTWGRIRCDSRKQGKDVLYLESCHGFNERKEDFPPDRLPIPELDLSKVPSYSFFPGQIVAMECTNPTGSQLVVHDIFDDRVLEPTSCPTLSEPLRLNIAAGPFTAFDNLDFEPLWELMERVVEEEPHALVLIGPFVDSDHQELKNLKHITYQELIDKTVASVMDKIRG